DLPSGNTPAETAGAAQSLRLGQVSLALAERHFGALSVENLPGQLLVNGSHLAGSPFDTLFEFLIQALDFGLRLFVPGCFNNVPTAAPLGNRKLMCSHYIQDFSSSACGERIGA